MNRRIPALVTAAALILAPLSTAQAAQPKKCSEGLSMPINATSTDQGTFTGALNITRFAAVGGQPVALATLTGTLIDENGVMTGIVRNVTLPLVLPSSGAASASSFDGRQAIAPQAICDILHLVLGPLDLNLLGLIVHLDTVVLDITADSAGGLLGALLCAIAGLLGGGSPLEQILNQLVGLLNQILAILS